MNNKKTKNILVILMISISVALVSSLATFAITNRSSDEVVGNKDVEEVMQLINDHYYLETDEKVLQDGQLKGIVNSLGDPFSSYLNSEEAKEFSQALTNEFVGIGVSIVDDMGTLYVDQVFEGSPAKKSGVERGDAFVKVNDTLVEGLSTTEVAKLVRGEKGTSVTIDFYRGTPENIVTFEIKRDAIQLVDLEYKSLENGVGYIDINDFTDDIAMQFSEAYDNLKEQGMKKLVIDVRDNGGGFLDQVKIIADMFLDEDQIIYNEQQKNKKAEPIYATDDKEDIEVAVLINENSASASELLAISLNENNGSELIGTTTYGKGIAQTTFNLSGGAILKLTFEKWLSPKKNWINKVGIEPTIKVVNSEMQDIKRLNIKESVKEDTVSNYAKNMQLILKGLGYENRTDGYFDLKTKESLMAFQKKNGISESGILDATTAAKLNEFIDGIAKDYKNDAQLLKAYEILKDE